jgi:hypothetical protein
LQEPVLVVLGLALEIHLCDQDVDLSAHVEVNVRRANESWCGGIAAGFDGLEAVPSLGICRKKSKPFEVRIERGRICIAWMRIAASGIRLPNF